MLSMSALSRCLLSPVLQINGGSGCWEGAGPFGRIDEAMRSFQHGAHLFGAFPEDVASMFREFHRDMGSLLGGIPGVMLCALRFWATFCSRCACSCRVRHHTSAVLVSALPLSGHYEVSSLMRGVSSLRRHITKVSSGPMHYFRLPLAAVESAATARAACWPVLQVPSNDPFRSSCPRMFIVVADPPAACGTSAAMDSP